MADNGESVVFASTPRLRLRALKKPDLPDITKHLGNWEVTKWLVRVPYPFSLQDAEKFFSEMSHLYQVGKPEAFAITEKNGDDIIGIVGCHNRSSQKDSFNESAEIGYWLAQEHWGRGYMSEALNAVVSLAFGRFGLQRLTARTDINNLASQNVLKKAGFSFLGIFPRPTGELRGSTEETRWQLMPASL